MTVYEVCGWFGDSEWSEGLWADEADAEKVCAKLWETRASDNGPESSRGLHKFAVDAREVTGGNSVERRLRKRIDQLTDQRDKARADLTAARKKLKTTQSALCAARKARDTAKAHVAYVRDLERRRFKYTRKVSTKAAA